MCSLTVWEIIFGAEERLVEDIAAGFLLKSIVRKSFALAQMRKLR